MNAQSIKRYCGNAKQVYGITECIRQDGRAAGTRELHLTTGGGMEAIFNASRCLDITSLRFLGHNLGFLAKPGVCYPPGRFHDSAFLGALTTCGLGTSGAGSEAQPFHGRIGTIAAADLCYGAQDGTLTIGGVMEESTLFGASFAVRRSVQCDAFGSTLHITDTVENNTENAAPYYLLYHINFGYPFLDAGLRLVLPRHTLRPRDAAAQKGTADFDVMYAPIDNYAEQVFFLENAEDTEGVVALCLENPALGIGVKISYENKYLPNLAMWKSLKSGDYALGIEPTNNCIMGHLKEQSAFSIAAYESVTIGFSLACYRL